MLALLGAGGLWSATGPERSVAAPGPRQAAGPGAGTASRPTETALAAALRRRGFRVNPGYPLVWGKDACATYLFPAFGSCMGNNPLNPYLIPVVKAWPDEHVGPSPPNAFGAVRPGFTPMYRLGVRDAIVLSATMPPRGKFMGWQTSVWSQPGRWTSKDYNRWARAPERPYPMQYLFATIPPGRPSAHRTMSWSSVGDAVNDVVMRRQSGDPWGGNRYFVITPSATTDRGVRRALRSRGVADRDIFTERIPRRDARGTIGPLGMGRNAIDFYSFFRYALPDDPAAAQRWWSNVPVTVLRVRGRASSGPVRRYERAVYGRRTARSEASLAGDLDRLVAAVCADVTRTAPFQSADCATPPPRSSYVPDPAHDDGWNAAYCRSVHMWCGDISDAGLYWTRPLPLDAGQVYAIVDTLATATGNATYVGLGVNNAATFLSPTGVTDAALRGSADAYGATVGHTDKFYVHYFTRNCGVLDPLLPESRRALDCTEIGPDMVPLAGDATAPGHAALRGMFWPGLRDYVLPGSAHGPDTSKLLKPRILAFTAP